MQITNIIRANAHGDDASPDVRKRFVADGARLLLLLVQGSLLGLLRDGCGARSEDEAKTRKKCTEANSEGAHQQAIYQPSAG